MPFQSQQQARFAFGTSQPWAKRWADETDFSKLPKRVQRIRRRRVKGCTCGETTKEQLAPGVTRIRGNLCNVHGKYGPCDAAASGKKPKKGRAAKPKKPVKTPEQRQQERQAQHAQNRANVLQRMNIAPDGQQALEQLRNGEQPTDTAALARAGFEQAGLVERGRDGSYRLTASGRAMMGAADQGDFGRAGATIGSARDRASARQERIARHKKPKGGKGGAVKKPATEAVAKPATEEAATPDAKRQENRASVRQAMADQDAGLAPAGFDNLMNLAEGKEPDKSGTDALISMGLAERGGDGTLRLTQAARNAVAASDRGDAKTAIDAISRAGDRVAQQRDRAAASTERRTAADRRRETADKRRAAADKRRAASDARAAARAETAANRSSRRRKEMSAIAKWNGTTWTALKDAGNPGDYLVVEDREKPSTWHLQVKRNGKPDHGLMGGAWAALHGGYRGNKYAGPQKGEALSELRALYVSEKMPLPSEKDWMGRTVFGDGTAVATPTVVRGKSSPAPLSSIPPSFTVFKDASGADRWVSISSTAYKDRDQEIVSTKALQGTVALADASGYRGPLRFWHVPGVEIGDCDFQATAQDGRFLIESGTFRSPALAAAVKERASGYQVSIGFTHPANEPDASGVFSHIAIFERSLVPKGRAANPFTQVVTKEIRMLTEEKVAKAKELFGEELLQDLLGKVATTDKAAQNGGIAYKDAPAETITINGVVYAPVVVTEKQADEETAEKAAPAYEEDAVDTAPEEKADGMNMGDGMEPEGDENMLTDAEIQSIAQACAQACMEAMMPHLAIGQKMDEVKSMLGGMSGNYAKKDAELAEVKEQLKTVTEQVADLSSSQPRILAGGYRASQANATVTTDETKLKQAQPSADPVAQSFAGWLQDMGINAQQPAP